jgi:hypothetical protein
MEDKGETKNGLLTRKQIERRIPKLKTGSFIYYQLKAGVYPTEKIIIKNRLRFLFSEDAVVKIKKAMGV